jgi:hypothetical protein
MKKFLLILAAVLTGIGLYVYLDPHLSRQLENSVREALPGQSPSSQVYKWRDRQGQWQITDRPPAEGVPYEVLEYDHDANLMPSEALTGRKPE